MTNIDNYYREPSDGSEDEAFFAWLGDNEEEEALNWACDCGDVLLDYAREHKEAFLGWISRDRTKLDAFEAYLAERWDNVRKYVPESD